MSYTPSYSYDPTNSNPLNIVRLRLGDTDFSNTATPPLSVVFSDQEITAMLTANANDPVLATCDCLLAIANNKARLHAFVSLQNGGTVDLRGAAAELRAQSKEMRDRYVNTPAFAVIGWDVGTFNARELLLNSILESQGQGS